MLVGTKADRAEDRAVTAEEGAELAEQEMLAGFLETSSREDINVEELFTILGQLILEGFAASGEDCDESRNAGATRISAARLAETGNSAPERRSYFRCC